MNYIKKLNKQNGLTLVELSLVLVVIALLVSAALSAKSLLEQSKLRNIVSQMKEIKSAVGYYKAKYRALPGDHDSATRYWQESSSCYSDTTGTKKTCDGDGNKKLAYVDAAKESSHATYEPWHFWKHLSNAEYIPGSFSGYSNNHNCDRENECMEVGVNVPAAGIAGSGWFAFSVSTYSSKIWQGTSNDRHRNILTFSVPTNGLWFDGEYPLTPTEQKSIDVKLDDGLPYKGGITDMSGDSEKQSPNCATENSDEFGRNKPGNETINAEYNTKYTDKACIMFIDLENF